jgi:hypothetical protein
MPGTWAILNRSYRNELITTLNIEWKEAADLYDTMVAAAIRIQNCWRSSRFLKKIFTTAYLGRMKKRIALDMSLRDQKLMQDQMEQRNARMAFYNENAVSIQKIWKGYRCRKVCMDFYARKNYLENLKFKVNAGIT